MVGIKAHAKMQIVGVDVVDGSTIVVDFEDGKTHEYKVTQLLDIAPSATARNDGWKAVARRK